jgi:hypothetical protein
LFNNIDETLKSTAPMLSLMTPALILRTPALFLTDRNYKAFAKTAITDLICLDSWEKQELQELALFPPRQHLIVVERRNLLIPLI